MFLQNTQQGDLRLARKLSDFIEEDRASFSHQARRSIPGADRGCYSVNMTGRIDYRKGELAWDGAAITETAAAQLHWPIPRGRF